MSLAGWRAKYGVANYDNANTEVPQAELARSIQRVGATEQAAAVVQILNNNQTTAVRQGGAIQSARSGLQGTGSPIQCATNVKRTLPKAKPSPSAQSHDNLDDFELGMGPAAVRRRLAADRIRATCRSPTGDMPDRPVATGFKRKATEVMSPTDRRASAQKTARTSSAEHISHDEGTYGKIAVP